MKHRDCKTCGKTADQIKAKGEGWECSHAECPNRGGQTAGLDDRDYERCQYAGGFADVKFESCGITVRKSSRIPEN